MNVFNILPAQVPFVTSTIANLMWSGAFRSLKTSGGLLWLMTMGLKYPGSRYLLGGMSLQRHIRNTLVPMMFDFINPLFFDLEHDIGNNIIRIRSNNEGEQYYNNGISEIEYFPMGTKNSWERFIMKEKDGALIDEAIGCDEESVKLVKTRLSGSYGADPAPFRITTYPGNASHWLLQWFNENKKYGWKHMSTTLYDAKDWNGKFVFPESYVREAEQANTGNRAMRYLHGKWVDDNDSFFDYGKHREWQGIKSRDHFQHIVSWCDPATMVGSDYSCIVTMGLINGDYVILDIDRSKTWEITETANAMKRMNEKWKPHQLYIETNGAGQPIWEYARRHGVPNLVGRHTKNKKEVRALPVQALWNNGHIFWDYYDDSIIREFCGFPHAKNDDVVDCVSGCCDLLAGGKQRPVSVTFNHSFG